MSQDSAPSNPDHESSEAVIERNFGPQPMDALMTEHGLANHQIVAASTEPMTHKAVQRARKGRKLTQHMQRRMVTALNRLLAEKGLEALPLESVFNYKA
jgi:hypothetical protein